MILYLIKSGICLAIILAVYHLVLEREKMHHFNRYYLLIGLVLAFVAPLTSIESSNELLADYSLLYSDWIIEFAEVNLETATAFEGSILNLSTFFQLTYLIIFGLFLLQFIVRLGILIQKALTHQRIYFQTAELVLVEEQTLPHTFGNFIFLNRLAYEQGTLEPELLTHELAHARQRHTLDVILIELLKVVFWFNPLLYFYKRAIQLNHEFLADDAVIKSHQAVYNYQHLLLDKASSTSKIYLASNLNFLLTKKRLNMMTKKSARWKTTILPMLSIPMFVALLLLFSNRITAQANPTIADEKAAFKKMKDNYFKDAIFIYEEDGKVSPPKSYTDLTEEEQAGIPMPPPPPPAPRGKSTKMAPLSKGTFVYFNPKKKRLKISDGSMAPPPPPPPEAPQPPPPPPPPPVPESGEAS